MANIITTERGGARYSLPPFPVGILPGLAVAIKRYRAGYADREGPDEWCASAAAIHETQPLSLADLAAKLIVAIHYRDPTDGADAFAVDVPDASEDRRAVEMELSCLDSLFAQLPAADDAELRDTFAAVQRAFLELKAQPHDLTDADTRNTVALALGRGVTRKTAFFRGCNNCSNRNTANMHVRQIIEPCEHVSHGPPPRRWRR